jgi:hypothetical protein
MTDPRDVPEVIHDLGPSPVYWHWLHYAVQGYYSMMEELLDEEGHDPRLVSLEDEERDQPPAG